MQVETGIFGGIIGIVRKSDIGGERISVCECPALVVAGSATASEAIS
jgi:hypothetical protein